MERADFKKKCDELNLEPLSKLCVHDCHTQPPLKYVYLMMMMTMVVVVVAASVAQT